MILWSVWYWECSIERGGPFGSYDEAMHDFTEWHKNEEKTYVAITAAENEQLQEILNAVDPKDPGLTDWQKGFMKDQHERYTKYGANIFLSPKQWAALKDAYEKVTGDTVDDPPPGAHDFDEERNTRDEDDEIPF